MMAAAIPRRVAWLGYGGLLPFIATAVGSAAASHHDPLWLDIQHAYGAVILSFIGALHWGVAMMARDLDESERDARYLWSGFNPAPAGQERRVLRALPTALWSGTLLLCLPSIAVRAWLWLTGTPADTPPMMIDIYAVSAIILHWTALFTVAIAAFIVMVMKGAAYVADAYRRADLPLLAWLFSRPWLRWLLEPAYALFARHREKISAVLGPPLLRFARYAWR